MNDLVAGAWRNGLDEKTTAEVKHIEDRRKMGFLQLPYESTVIKLVDLLDSQDFLIEELLTEE